MILNNLKETQCSNVSIAEYLCWYDKKQQKISYVKKYLNFRDLAPSSSIANNFKIV